MIKISKRAESECTFKEFRKPFFKNPFVFITFKIDVEAKVSKELRVSAVLKKVSKTHRRGCNPEPAIV